MSAFGYELEVTDFISVAYQFHDIFLEHEYELPTLGSRPVIIDVGANVGVSVLFFCKTLDNPEIHAFEADPEVFKRLQSNILKYAGDANVKLLNAAAYHSTGTVLFSSEGADGGHISEGYRGDDMSEIPSIDLLTYLDKFERIELLKMDIEGAEATVFPRCAPVLDKIERVFIEFHSSSGKHQSIVHILSILQESGFRLHLRSADNIRSPFTSRNVGGFDNQVNIFAYRNKI